MDAEPRKAKRNMHDGKKVLGFSEAQKIKRTMKSKRDGTVDAYRCNWNDDGTRTSIADAHWHTGRPRKSGNEGLA